MVALDKLEKSNENLLYGAVSMGNAWQFGVLDRQAKRLAQNLTLYRVPEDLETLLEILVAILKGD